VRRGENDLCSHAQRFPSLSYDFSTFVLLAVYDQFAAPFLHFTAPLVGGSDSLELPLFPCSVDCYDFLIFNNFPSPHDYPRLSTLISVEMFLHDNDYFM
jgi:hypothetical protein